MFTDQKVRLAVATLDNIPDFLLVYTTAHREFTANTQQRMELLARATSASQVAHNIWHLHDQEMLGLIKKYM